MLIVYTVCYNEELFLPYFLRHYEKIADRIVIYDNRSTDRSAEIIKSHPKATCHSFDTGNQLGEQALTNIRNQCWKADNADWAIVCDVDEIIYHPDLLKFIENHKEYSVIRPHGYTMISTVLPTTTGQIYDELKDGVRYPFFDKCELFSPKRISDMNFGPGSHSANPVGDFNLLYTGELKLLHYRYLTLERTIKKYHHLATRRSPDTIAHGWATQYVLPDDKITDVFNSYLKNAEEVV
jgi:glycosyltransferase involved in cell wall biosynthesis